MKVKGSTALRDLEAAHVLAAGQGTKVFEVGDYRIGCLICADGSHPAAWETFKHDRPDLIFRQNNPRRRGRRETESLRQTVARVDRGRQSLRILLGLISNPAEAVWWPTTEPRSARPTGKGEEEIVYCDYRTMLCG